MLENQVCEGCKKAGNTNPNNCQDCVKLHQDYAKLMAKDDPIVAVQVIANYTQSYTTRIELPLYVKWEDITECWVKWNDFCYRLKGDEEKDIPTRIIPLTYEADESDMKRPDDFNVYDEEFNTMLQEGIK